MLDYKIRYCPKCGHIEDLSPKLRPLCKNCNSNLIDTEYNFLDADNDNGDLKPEIRKAIFEKYIKDNPEYSEDAVKDREEQEKYDRLHMPSSSGYSSQNTPKCPTCQSTNIEKISDVKKAAGFLTVGVFSKNFGKTYHCRNCDYRW